MNPLVSLSFLAGTHAAIAPGAAVVLGVLALGWTLLSRRRRSEERAVKALVGLHVGTMQPQVPGEPELPEWFDGADDGAGANTLSEAEKTQVLVLASLESRRAVLACLDEFDGHLAVADSAWSARAACRDAFDAGRPYNLVLLDASLAEVGETGARERLQEELQAWGARVAVMRRSEEGTRSHENPDCRGRGGLAAPARGDAAALGLRRGAGE